MLHTEPQYNIILFFFLLKDNNQIEVNMGLKIDVGPRLLSSEGLKFLSRAPFWRVLTCKSIDKSV